MPQSVKVPDTKAVALTHINYTGLLPSGFCAAFSLKSFFSFYGIRDRQQFRLKFLGHLGLPSESLVWAEQVHGIQVTEVRDPQWIAGTDGLVTGQTGLFLTIAVADCLPIFLWCKDPPAIALLHAGWRGSAGGIAVQGVRMMQEHIGCQPRSMGALLGPAICASCYQVGMEVAQLFPISDRRQNDKGEFFLDLRRSNFRQLEEAGVLVRNIRIDELCTRCNPNLLFSYRRDGAGTGRMIAVLGMVAEATAA